MFFRALVAGGLIASATALRIPRDLSVRQASNTTSHTIELRATLWGSRFHAPVTIGDETFNLLIDTGSSDTFVVEDDFECTAPTGWGDDLITVSQDACGYADDEYELGDSNTFQLIRNESFQVIYGAGIARGLMAFEDIALGGITVTDQRFGLVNWSTPMNLGSSGVLGLAYPVITSAWELNGTIDEESLTYQGENLPYTPLFVNMARRGLVAPYFSLALNRLDSDHETGPGGYMVLGGLPDVDLAGSFTAVPAEFYDDAPYRTPNGTRLRSYWATTVERINYGGNGEYSDSYQTIVDTGAPLSSVPAAVAEAYNARFDPPGSWSTVQGAYLVQCDSTPPRFSVTLGGTTFETNPDDLILHAGDDDLCLSAITHPLQMGVDENEAANTTDVYILGASFLKGVVSVFDFGNSEMRFAVRDESAAPMLEMLGSARVTVLVAAVVVLQGLL
ncbi:aspartic peptidase domain-containing protein [Aspergillus granulosus]|uniref:Aspartic peptidase domain-containing protein n=1 Tax=Aspergillus granulosus TaxID=176169 RepID=A0ABR4H787_9EURO